MAKSRTLINMRRRHHDHALERLRERYWPEAEMADVIAIRDGARARAVGRPSLNGWSDGIGVGVPYRGVNVQVIYSRRYDAVRTVLPIGEISRLSGTGS